MAARSDQECHELFDKITKSFKEYSTEDCDINEEPIKSKILDILKTYRPVKLADYEFGLSRYLKKNHRLILKEREDQSKVRQYTIRYLIFRTLFLSFPLAVFSTRKGKEKRIFAREKRKGKERKKRKKRSKNEVTDCRKGEALNKWRCTAWECRKTMIRIIYGILFAPFHSNHICPTKDYSAVMKVQNQLKKKELALLHSSDKLNHSNNVSNQSLSTSMLSNTNDILAPPALEGPFLNNHQSSQSRRSKRITKQSSTKNTQTQINLSNSDDRVHLNNDIPHYEPLKQTDVPDNSTENKNSDILKSTLAETSSSSTNITFLTNNESEIDLYVSSAALIEESAVEINTAAVADTTSSTFFMLSNNHETEMNISSEVATNSSNAGIGFVPANNSSTLKRTFEENASEEGAENHAAFDIKRPKVENSAAEETECIIIEPIDQKPESLPIVLNDPFDPPLPFERPSSKMLKDVCQKLNVAYCNKGYDFWSKIQLEEIPTVAVNLKLHHFKTKNIFECFSLLFTGGTEQSFLIQYTINGAYRNKLVRSGNMSQKEIDRTFIPSTVSDEHLAFIAEFSNCRIALFENSKLCRFGKWDSDIDVLTFVFSYSNGFYSVVLNL